MKKIILGGGLNSGKGAILRHLATGNIDSPTNLDSIDLTGYGIKSLLLTDVIRKEYAARLSSSERDKVFPKFGRTFHTPKPTTQTILDALGGVEGWVETELQETEYLFEHEITSRLTNHQGGDLLVAGVGISPEGLYRYLQNTDNQDAYYISFMVKTSVEDILARLEKDKSDPVHQNGWPLRLDSIQDAANIIAKVGSNIAERADKIGFRVVDVSANPDPKYISESERIQGFLGSNKDQKS